MKLATACVGGPSAELVDASISAQSSLLGSSNPSSEFDGDDNDLVSTEEEVDDVQTTTTMAAAMGVLTTTVTTTKKRAVQKHRQSHSSHHRAIDSPSTPNNIGLDIEMRHVAEMEEMARNLMSFYFHTDYSFYYIFYIRFLA